ncbi:MAG TPA: glucose-6-phosphate dehydrogenase [Bryobacteraceae bacterium]|jgi:glucose-6-phosphate 1-dehydrogenase
MTPVKEPSEQQQPARPADPCIMVIFGASGDLTGRKLIPAIYNLANAGLLPKNFGIVGVAIDGVSEEDFRKKARQDMQEHALAPVDCGMCDSLVERLSYISGDFKDPEMYRKIAVKLAEMDAALGTPGNYFFYLAVSPMFFAEIVKQLGAANLHCETDHIWRRVVIEKPFGNDLESARSLNREILKTLAEKQIYRIDHYLGKETVQNILVFRFSNGIFEPVWNRRYIDHVQITAGEELGVERRGGYYDHAGALRDMVPNHVMQLISLTAMEPPVSFQADAVRDEQAKVLHAISPLSAEDVLSRAVRGQYGAGIIGSSHVPAYRAEPMVDPNSNTETFVALKLSIDNWRWADVPFYVRTGKRLPSRVTEIAIQFRRAPFVLFRDTPVEKLTPNLLVMHIQPDEGISLRFGAKVPGPQVRVGAVNMDFHYADYFGTEPSTGYERLLYDCMIGDATLFQRADMVEAGWSVVQPVLDIWKALPARSFPNYPAGTWGPREAEELLRRDNRHWRDL